MNKTFISILVCISGLATAAIGQDGGADPEFSFVREMGTPNQVRLQAGFGWLDSFGAGASGVSSTNLFSVQAEMAQNFALTLGIPFAGTLSDGNDDFGIGNLVIGAKYVSPGDSLGWGIGLDVGAPTAQAGAIIGAFTRPYLQFVDNQTAISPYGLVSFTRNRVVISLDAGADFQLWSKTPPGESKAETVLFYDAALAYSIYDNIWLTVEGGGYSTVSYQNIDSPFFVGPGIRYQDKEVSIGFHVIVPVNTPPSDVINVTGQFEVRVSI